ncbi:hypothetical protein ASC77_11600 [Nocardioides sp. Root1257]|uniref:type IV toxin-antitoxin system AbiEi family antitoxin domain-containing protein n=1 Tax=unclassified Nocardioides TaxID=2615069 RepID=UPI0006FB49E4|nr:MULTISPECIES: type IV toxin-antitoxin system AbiEi family antitoxin domain-containing protein [unclassified Nocardioides]KQW49320.1 hypothetical protein ASC77_11600 [Nocardioides sp. Root1257]KRC48494.1 hypothetical protein ASE24_11605 [Nocardioides sp. Root224]
MQPKFAYYLTHQHGLIRRRQVLAAGMTVQQIATLVRGREWVVIRRGVYTTRAHWESLDRYVGRPQLEVWAAVLQMQTPHIVSHDSAAYLHRLPILEAKPRLVHITRIGALGGRTRHGVKHHKAPVRTERIEFIDDHPVLDLPRTVADIGREHGLRHAAVAANSALRRGVSRNALREAVAEMRCWPYVTVPRLAVEWADGRCENPGEDLTMLMLKQLGLGLVHAQFGIQERGRVAWVDFRIGRHLVEFDGRHKYQRDADGGYADRPAEEVVLDEKNRQDWLCGFKLGMSRVIWSEVQPDTWDETQLRLHREITDTARRFGTSVDDLAPYVIRRRRR